MKRNRFISPVPVQALWPFASIYPCFKQPLYQANPSRRLIDLCIEKSGQVEIIMQVGVYVVVSCQISNFGRVNAQRTITSAFLFARSSSKMSFSPLAIRASIVAYRRSACRTRAVLEMSFAFAKFFKCFHFRLG